jgi:hypothetical protein
MGREIIVMEHPGLHLIWYHNRIFVKPIPLYMLSRAFWEYIAEADQDILRAALGFMRTYCYLVRYDIDFRKALELHLIPEVRGSPVDFEGFVEFILQFEDIPDEATSPRYTYGSIRLTRLNYLALVSFGRPAYFAIRPQYGDYISHSFVPIVTLFVVFSTILSSMQVALTVQDPNAAASWNVFTRVAKWFSVTVIILVMILAVIVGFFLPLILVRAQRTVRRKELLRKHDKDSAGEMTTAFI